MVNGGKIPLYGLIAFLHCIPVTPFLVTNSTQYYSVLQVHTRLEAELELVCVALFSRRLKSATRLLYSLLVAV